MKRVSFVNRRYMIGAPFLSKMVYKWVKGWTSGRRLPLQIFVLYPPGGGGGGCRRNPLSGWTTTSFIRDKQLGLKSNNSIQTSKWNTDLKILPTTSTHIDLLIQEHYFIPSTVGPLVSEHPNWEEYSWSLKRCARLQESKKRSWHIYLMVDIPLNSISRLPCA